MVSLVACDPMHAPSPDASGSIVRMGGNGLRLLLLVCAPLALSNPASAGQVAFTGKLELVLNGDTVAELPGAGLLNINGSSPSLTPVSYLSIPASLLTPGAFKGQGVIGPWKPGWTGYFDLSLQRMDLGVCSGSYQYYSSIPSVPRTRAAISCGGGQVGAYVPIEGDVVLAYTAYAVPPFVVPGPFGVAAVSSQSTPQPLLAVAGSATTGFASALVTNDFGAVTWRSGAWGRANPGSISLVAPVAVAYPVPKVGVTGHIRLTLEYDRPAGAEGQVFDVRKLSHTSGNFTGGLYSYDYFGSGSGGIGDLDGDGVPDVIIGAYGEDDSGGVMDAGTLFVVLLNPDGSAKSTSRIGEAHGDLSGPGNPGGVLEARFDFGMSATRIGDVDGDGVVDIAVGGCGGTAGSCNDRPGRLFILLMRSDGTVRGTVKIEDGVAGLPAGTLGATDQFGFRVAEVGDFNGDGIPDLLVGAYSDEGGGTDRGAVYILYLDVDGTVGDFAKIGDTSGGFSPAGNPADVLVDADHFGRGVTSIGDLDGDGVTDIAVGASGDDTAHADGGAVWIVWLNPDGSVKDKIRITEGVSGFAGDLLPGDRFGWSVAALGDLDGDGVIDLGVTADLDDDGGADRGAAWILFLDPTGTVKDHQKISDLQGGFGGWLDDNDRFGATIAPLGDLDGDGVTEIGVGARYDDDAYTNAGAYYVLGVVGEPALCGDGVLDPIDEDCDDGNTSVGDGCYASCRYEHSVRIFGTAQGGSMVLDVEGYPVTSLTAPGDDAGQIAIALADAIGVDPSLQALGISATAMGDRVYTDGLITDGASLDPGVVMSVFPGSVRGYLKISDDTGGLSGPGATPSNPGGLLADVDRFGASAAGLGDLDGDGFLDVVVGATGDDDGAIVDGGAVYVLRLNDDGTVKARQRINDSEGGLSGPGNPGGQVGSGALLGFFSTRLGDIDGDGVVDIAVSGCGLAGGCNDPSQSALWVLRMNADGTAKASVRIRDGEGGLPPGTLADVAFDGAIAGLGDMNGDRVPDLVVGEWSENGSGAVYILYLAPDGSVASFLRISDIEGGLSGPGDPGGTLAPGDGFGFGLAGLGDLDGNGVPDMAVGAPGDDSAGVDRGAVWILWLNPDGTVATKRRIATGQSGFAGLTKAGDSFGVALSSLGDLDGDGVLDLAVGARNDRTLEANDGSVWILFLNPDASVKSHQKISPLEGRFDGGIDFSDRFGGAVTALGDIDGDGVMDLGVGAIGDSVAGNWRGAFWELFLDGAPIVCGNGVLDPVVEECDDGNAISEDGCSDACVDEYCGDGVVQVGLGETCEDGNSVDEDGCSSSCVAEYCGDGIVQAGLGETCDDGGTAWGDGCSAECWPEADSYDLYRFAFGGTLSITINGVTVVVQIPAGATASEALSLLAQAIESHPTLSAMGVRASVDGNRLYTSAPIASLTVGDPWLAQTPSTATVSAHVDRAGFDAVLPGPASIEDFESLTDGAPVSALGPLSFSEMVVGEDLRATDAFDTQSPILSLGLDNPDEALLDGDALYIDASMPLDAIGLYVVASDAVLPGEIRLVTPLGATLGDAAPVGTLADGGLVYFLGFASDQTFDQALVGFEGDGEVNFVYTADDVLYHVPEPAIGMMLAAGTALLGVLERRRRGTRGLGEREKR